MPQNITSMSGITSDSQSGQEAYNSSKAACLSLTRLMAADFKHPDVRVRVNSIARKLWLSFSLLILEADPKLISSSDGWTQPATSRPR